MTFKEQLEVATSPGPNQIPGAVIIAADRSGESKLPLPPFQDITQSGREYNRLPGYWSYVC